MMGGRRVWFLGPERSPRAEAVPAHSRSSKRLSGKRLPSGAGAAWGHEACWSGLQSLPELCSCFARAPGWGPTAGACRIS